MTSEEDGAKWTIYEFNSRAAVTCEMFSVESGKKVSPALPMASASREQIPRIILQIDIHHAYDLFPLFFATVHFDVSKHQYETTGMGGPMP